MLAQRRSEKSDSNAEILILSLSSKRRNRYLSITSDPFQTSSRAAFGKERAAADWVANQLDLEPTRAVLRRSAAVLALECSELREAERLIGRALAGNPPDDIANELRDLLLEEIYSQRQAIGH
jgi:hypothetical protein